MTSLRRLAIAKNGIFVYEQFVLMHVQAARVLGGGAQSGGHRGTDAGVGDGDQEIRICILDEEETPSLILVLVCCTIDFITRELEEKRIVSRDLLIGVAKRLRFIS